MILTEKWDLLQEKKIIDLEKDPTFQAKDENIKKKFKSLNNDHGYS